MKRLYILNKRKKTEEQTMLIPAPKQTRPEWAVSQLTLGEVTKLETARATVISTMQAKEGSVHGRRNSQQTPVTGLRHPSSNHCHS